MIMFECLRGSAPAYLADYCTSSSLVIIIIIIIIIIFHLIDNK